MKVRGLNMVYDFARIYAFITVTYAVLFQTPV